MPPKPLNHNDPRRTRTRQAALSAALELIAERGQQGCTFERVSERSGIARSTLYRHWSNKTELIAAALESTGARHVAPDTGNLRDDLLAVMLQLGDALQTSTWGALVPQLVAAASLDPGLAVAQREEVERNVQIDAGIIRRAVARGELSEEIDAEHLAVLFSAPIFFRHLYSHQPIDARWITAHVDKTIALLGLT